MSLSKADQNKLRKIISLAESLLKSSGSKSAAKSAKKSKKASKTSGKARTRRSGAELKQFRQMLIAERKAGVPVAQLAKKHGVSLPYIYQL